MRPTLTIITDTYLKPGPGQAVSYPATDLAKVIKGTTIPILAYRQEQDHIVFTVNATAFNLKNLHESGKNTWWVYEGHCMDPQGYSSSNNPQDAVAAKPIKSMGIVLPGLPGKHYGNDAITIKAPNFTWAEALHMGSTGDYRQPIHAGITYNIIQVAEVMQGVRRLFNGASITIHSWYRDPSTNRRVGGASQSRHMSGDAVDFSVEGMSLVDVYNKLDPWWNIKGGLARGDGFVHIDCRGYRARWTYPGVK